MGAKLPLAAVVDVDKDKCVNCHACVSACPVKFANDASGSYVKVNKDLCIGCGACIKACTHNARYIVDDLKQFLESIERQEPIVAISAPAVAASFPHAYLNLNGWLKSIGVSAVFDVSFGAELTVKSYLEHIKQSNPKCVIAQPCPAIVSYIEIYRPELLPYLAPADSPMMHTIKMIKEFYPQYRQHKIVIISPCAAKRREFDEVGMGEFNVTMANLEKYFKTQGISLQNYPAVDFDNPPAERAVLFSTPGGLKDTAMRWNPNIQNVTRKIEGVHCIYKYLDELPEMIRKGMAPMIIDCLNCEMGCNGGPGTLGKDKPLDEVEWLVAERKEEMKHRYESDEEKRKDDQHLQGKIENVINQYWKPELYNRLYCDRSGNKTYVQPTQPEVKGILESMAKTKEEDIKNCTSCGYNKCEKMAEAIYNNLNQRANCHFYAASLVDKADEHQKEMLKRATLEFDRLVNEIKTSSDVLEKIEPILKAINSLAKQTNLLATNATIQAAHAGQYGATFNVVAKEIKELAHRTKSEADKIKPVSDDLRKTFLEIVDKVKHLSEKILENLNNDWRQNLQGNAQTVSTTSQNYNVASEKLSATKKLSMQIAESKVVKDITTNKQ